MQQGMWCIFIPNFFQQPLTSFLYSWTVWVFDIWYHIPYSKLARRLKKSVVLVFTKHCKGIMSWLIPPPPPITYYYKKTKSPWNQESPLFFFHLKIVSTYNLQRNIKPLSPVTLAPLGVWSHQRRTILPEPRKCQQTEIQDPDFSSMGQGDYLVFW